MQLEPVSIELPNASASLVMEVFEQDGRIIAGIRELRGAIALPPKAWLRTVRAEVEKIEQKARLAGCVELWIRGRDWSRVLPDYSPREGVPNGIRKAL